VRRVTLSAIGVAVVALAASCGDRRIIEVTGPSAQRCQTTLTGLPSSVPPSGGRLNATVVTNRECSWTAASEASWVQVAPPSGQGGASLTVMVAENPAAVARSAAIVLNDNRVMVAQDAAACRFDLPTSSARISAEGGSLRVVVSSVAGCAWSAASEASWVRVVGGQATGSGSAELRVDQNTGRERTGTVKVAGLTFRVEQGGATAPPTPPTPPSPTPTPPPSPTPPPTPAACSFSLTPERREVRADGDNTSVRVRTDSRCEWTATTSASWITLSTTRGTGDAEVRYTVERNTGPARQGTITIGGQTHRVEQEAARSSRVNFKGRISNLSGACPNLRFTVEGRQVMSDSTTRFTEGSCGDLRSGMEAKIEGELRADGVVRATKVELED
jgi:hypothetical protein